MADGNHRGKEIQMEVRGLFMDPINRMPIVVLANPDQDALLPIWIGMAEASAIAMQLENVLPPRPMTHDLMRNIIQSFSAHIEKVVVHSLHENTFYAWIVLRTKDGHVVLDARPSDAIALALRFHAPIYVNENIVRDSVGLKLDDTQDALKQWLESLEPDDLGKYQA